MTSAISIIRCTFRFCSCTLYFIVFDAGQINFSLHCIYHRIVLPVIWIAIEFSDSSHLLNQPGYFFFGETDCRHMLIISF